MNKTGSKNKNLQLIQVLRGLAALLVVLFHATLSVQERLNKHLLYDFFTFGSSGVDIFFVLSGFIITYTSINNIGKINNFFPFIRRRAIRIYPAYWIIISAFLILQTLLPSFYRTHFSFDLKNILSTYFLLPGHIGVNGVSWSMSYEIFFYLLFSVTFFIPKKSWSLSIAFMYALLIILISLLGYNFEHTKNNWLQISTNPLVIEFILGVFATVLIKKISSKISILLIFSGGILFLINGILQNGGFKIFDNSFHRVVLFGVPSFLLITGLVKYELMNEVKARNIFLLLGEASYSLYLIHLPLLVACFKIIVKLNIQSNFMFYTIVILFILFICCMSILFYKTVEKPITDKLNSLRKIKFVNEI